MHMSDSEQKGFWAKHWKMIVNVVTLVALVVLIYLVRDDITSTFDTIRR